MSHFEVREYQLDIIKEVLDCEDNILIQLPTGGGKTYIATEIIKELSQLFGKFQQTLFIAPKIVLMEQTEKAFNSAKLKPQKIHGQNKFNINGRVLVSTIHTASRRDELQPDIIMIDEIHYGFNGQMLKNIIDNNPDSRLIGLSATPYDQNGKKLKGFKYIDNIDVNFLMSNNYLVKKLRQYELVKQDLSKIKIIAGDYEKKQLSEFVCDRNKILEIVESTKEFIDNSKKTIVFAVDIAHAEQLTKAYQKIGFKAKSLHSQLKNDDDGEPIEINDEIELFRKGQTKILVSVLMLTTGFDVPDTDCAVIARPTRSQNLYKQMVGRILRKSENKNEAILLDCGNVISELGMPLEPIKEVSDTNIDNRHKCKECKSLNIKLTKIDEKLFWICEDCSFQNQVESGSYKCESCSEVHSYNSDFCIEDFKLKLNCQCGYKTIISEYTNEQFIEIEDTSIKEEYLPFLEAREYIRSLNLKNMQEWKKYKSYKNKESIELKIPLDPHIFYKNDGWIDYYNWIGEKKHKKTNIKVSDYITFENAKKFAQELNLKTVADWKKYCKGEFPSLPKLPINIPTQPEQVYSRQGWKNYKDFLFKGFLSFEDAKNFVINLNLKDRKEWVKYCKGEFNNLENKPNNIPRDPELRYRKDWINWEDWLKGSTEKIYAEWCSFEEARQFAQSLNLSGQVEWKKYCKNELDNYNKKPANIPASPDVVYKENWKGYGDWLGNIKIGNLNQRNLTINQKDIKKIVKDINQVSLDEIAEECDVSVKDIISKSKEINIDISSENDLVSLDVADKIASYILKE